MGRSACSSRKASSARSSKKMGEEGSVSKKMDKKMANKLKRQAAKQEYKQRQQQVMTEKGQKTLPRRIPPHLIANDKPWRSRVLWYPECRAYSRRELLLDRLMHMVAMVTALMVLPCLGIASYVAGHGTLQQIGFWAAGLGLNVMCIASFTYHYCCWEWNIVPKLQLLQPLAICGAILGISSLALSQCECYKSLGALWALGLINVMTLLYKLHMTHQYAGDDATIHHRTEAASHPWSIPENSAATSTYRIDTSQIVCWVLMTVIFLYWVPLWLQHFTAISTIGICAAAALPLIAVNIFVMAEVEFHIFAWNFAIMTCVFTIYLIVLSNVV